MFSGENRPSVIFDFRKTVNCEKKPIFVGTCNNRRFGSGSVFWFGQIVPILVRFGRTRKKAVRSLTRHFEPLKNL